MLCAASIDRSAREDASSIDGALDRARDDHVVVQLYGHRPGVLSDLARIDAIAAGARARGLAGVTYRELADQPPATAGLALSFDDDHVDEWLAAADVLDRHGLRVTFFVTRYHLMTAAERAGLAELARRGHDIEAHGVDHLRGPAVVDDRGLAAYLADEVVPSIEALRADGFPVRAFAYPFGARTSAIDRAVLEHVDVVRSVSYSRDSLLVVDPCPE
ncbi:MAG: polysaccharide deacetylase family protein [Myxococcales bacterium]|nr:polysaccharide deacetylase family protein [Myxococcales bacterium]